MGIREAPFQVRNGSIVRDFRAEVVRVLEVDLRIGGPTWLVSSRLSLAQSRAPTGEGSTKISFNWLLVLLTCLQRQSFSQAGERYAESA